MLVLEFLQTANPATAKKGVALEKKEKEAFSFS